MRLFIEIALNEMEQTNISSWQVTNSPTSRKSLTISKAPDPWNRACICGSLGPTHNLIAYLCLWMSWIDNCYHIGRYWFPRERLVDLVLRKYLIIIGSCVCLRLCNIKNRFCTSILIIYTLVRSNVVSSAFLVCLLVGVLRPVDNLKVILGQVVFWNVPFESLKQFRIK